MTEKRYIYVSIGIGFEILDSWFGYTGDGEPTEREIEEYDYLVIGLASNQDVAEGICRRLNDQQDEINHLSNFGLHVILDKKNKEIEQLKQVLMIYRKVAYCGNCNYHNYDWYDDGDEFEVCEKGNDMSDYICEEWREL